MRILLCHDLSPPAEAAERLLVRLPLPDKTTIDLLTVVEPIRAFSLADEERDAIQERTTAQQQAQGQAIEAVGRRLRDAGATVGETETRIGHPAEVIVGTAADRGPDLLVVGNRGRAGIRRFLLGSVSDRVSQHAPCSVLVAREPLAPARSPELRVLLAWDGSPPARAAIDLLRSLRPNRAARLTLVHVLPAPTVLHEDRRMARLYENHRKSMLLGLSEAHEELKPVWPDIEAVIRSGDASEQLLEAAADAQADLILAGSEGDGALRRFLLGSVSSRLVRHADCSVWIVRVARERA